MTQDLAIPSAFMPAAVGSVETYVQTVNRFPILSAEEEIRLARQFHTDGNLDAARRLVLSHLRVVVATVPLVVR